MISPISFRSTIKETPTVINETPKAEKPVATSATVTTTINQDKKSDSFIKKSIKSYAHAKKTYVTVKEGFFGAISSVAAGLGVGAGILSLDWYIMKLSGHGNKNQSIITTPIKTVGSAIAGVSKKAWSVWNKTVKQIIAYPFVGFPKDIAKYVSDVKGCSKYGKHIAVGLGIAAAALSAGHTLVKINHARAEVDHGFRIGHNA